MKTKSIYYEPGTEGLVDPNDHLKAALEAVAATARALKKERDEAREERDIARLSAQDSDKAHDRMVGELEKVYKERDDAVAECKSLWSLVNANKLRAYKAERERDDLREELCHLRACVFDALSALDAGAFEELKKAWEEGAK